MRPAIIHRTVKNAFWLLLSEILAKGATFVVSLYLARKLGVSSFGMFSLAIAVGMYVWSFVDMGVSSYGIREVAQQRQNAEYLLGTLNTLRLAVAVTSLLVLTAACVIQGVTLDMSMTILIGALYVIPAAFSPEWLLKGMERIELIALGNGVMAIVFAATILWSVKQPDDAVQAIAYRNVSFFAASLTMLTVMKARMKVSFSLRISLKDWMAHVKESLYFAVSMGLNTIQLYIPFLFLGWWSNAYSLGMFSAPQRVILVILNGALVLPMATYPVLSALYSSNKDDFYGTHKTIERLLLYVGLPTGVFCILYRKEIVLRLFGADYLPGAELFGILCIIIPLMMVRTNYGRSLASAGHHRYNMIAIGAGAVTTAMVCAISVRTHAAVAASWAVVAGESVILLLMGMMFHRRVYRSKLVDAYFVKVIFCTICAGSLAAVMGPHRFYGIVIGVMTYVGVSLTLGLVNKKHISSVWHRSGNGDNVVHVK